jgi:DNA-binding NarL/FixJ family response regulator
MPRRNSELRSRLLESHPPLPLTQSHWSAIVATLKLSEQLATVAELLLRGFSVKEIATVTELGEGTVKDYVQRIGRRTGTHGRMQLAMRVLAVSHQVNGQTL